MPANTPRSRKREKTHPLIAGHLSGIKRALIEGEKRPAFLAVSGRISMVVCLFVAACTSSTPQPLIATPIRLADCTGPATSLPARIADTLTPRPDIYMARDVALASTVPGGFAGVLYDSTRRPVLLLTRPQAADSARAALVTALAGSRFPVASASVQVARWDYQQLALWYSYIYPHLSPDRGATTSSIDVIRNRIAIGVIDSEARDRIARELVELRLPCDLVMVTVTGPNQLY